MANIPSPNKLESQRAEVSPWLQRTSIQLNNLNWTNPAVWRHIVHRQGYAILARQSIIEYISTFDWRIDPKDSNQRDELRNEIKYYTKIFEQHPDYSHVGFTETIEFILKDSLDLPFGAGMELIWKDDNPSKRLRSYVFIDGATLFPTNNSLFPVVQKTPSDPKPVVFPKHAINRLFYSPRTEMDRLGWGMAPPEKIYLAINAVNMGDLYYASLLSDTPETGILDLGDMSKSSAEKWIKSWRDLLGGIDPFKIPVLYEHNSDAKYIPFNRSPTELQYQSVILIYASIIAGGYGVSLSDLGVQVASNGGETLSGTIRQERKGRRRGYGITKKKITQFFNRMLPSSLEFKIIDPDDEQAVAKGRALLSISTSTNHLINQHVFSPQEVRAIIQSMGLFSVSLPENVPDESEFPAQQQQGPARENMLTATVPPSQGGQGEVRQANHHISNVLVRAIDDVSFDPEILKTLILPFDENVIIGVVWNSFNSKFNKLIEKNKNINLRMVVEGKVKTALKQLQNDFKVEISRILDENRFISNKSIDNFENFDNILEVISLEKENIVKKLEKSFSEELLKIIGNDK